MSLTKGLADVEAELFAHVATAKRLPITSLNYEAEHMRIDQLLTVWQMVAEDEGL